MSSFSQGACSPLYPHPFSCLSPLIVTSHREETQSSLEEEESRSSGAESGSSLSEVETSSSRIPRVPAPQDLIQTPRATFENQQHAPGGLSQAAGENGPSLDSARDSQLAKEQPVTLPNSPPHLSNRQDEEDDGAVLARLIARAVEMRAQQNQLANLEQATPNAMEISPTLGPSCPSRQPSPVNAEEESRGEPDNDEPDTKIDEMEIDVPHASLNEQHVSNLSPREQQAVDFLGSLFHSLTKQIRKAVKRIHKPEHNRRQLHHPSETPALEIRISLTSRRTGNEQHVIFPDEPGSNPTSPSLLRLARIFLVSSAMYQAILSSSVVSKRDIYYRNVTLFRSQSSVDKIIDDLACTANLKRQDFHVRAATKGLMASNALQLTLSNGDLPPSSTPTLIPPISDIAHLHAQSLDWILIVEKDAVMQTLSSALLTDPRLGPGVILTGKGYPDLSTLQLASRLASDFPTATLHALVDGDPHGLDILRVYVYGSRANRFSPEHAELALGDRLRWMGVRPSEWSKLGRYEDLLDMTERDERLALRMCLGDIDTEWRRELSYMLHLRKKAEIQIISGEDEGGNRLVEYVVSRLA